MVRRREGSMGIHRLALIGDPPEHRNYRAASKAGDWKIPIIHSTALLEAFVTVDCGTERATSIGARTWLMKRVHIGHDAQIGEDCELSPGAVICGHAVLEDSVRIGVNASVLPFRRVGKGARVGAGAVVTHDVPPGEVWAGVPARKLEEKPPFGWYLDAGVQLGLAKDLAEREAQLLAVCAEHGIEPPDGLASLRRLRQLEELRDAVEHGQDVVLASLAAEVRKA